jgi:site-specific recombinase XerD
MVQITYFLKFQHTETGATRSANHKYVGDTKKMCEWLKRNEIEEWEDGGKWELIEETLISVKESNR